MLIRDLATTGAMPTLESMLRFSGQRQRLLAHNIANIDTPGFQPRDADPLAFQATLARAVDERRERTGGVSGDLTWNETREVRRVDARGGLELTPRTPGQGILHHDRNNSDLERIMQDLVENAAVYRVAADLLRSQRTQLHNAIAQRVT